MTPFDAPAGTIIAESGTGNGGFAVADPRYADGAMGEHTNKMRVVDWEKPVPTVTGSDRVGSGAMCVADPRILNREKGDNYLTGGHYGVIPWDGQSYTVSGSACHDNGPWSVADPRIPGETENTVAVIRSLDGTWHRPFTTLELAAIQSLVDPQDLAGGGFDFSGTSDASKRERIGNAVPPGAAEQIANMMGETLAALLERGDFHALRVTDLGAAGRGRSQCEATTMRKHREFRAKGTAVLQDGAVVYDLLDSPEEAKEIAAICNDGIGPEWDAVEPELDRRRAQRVRRKQ